MSNLIVWTNYKEYDHKTIVERVSYVKNLTRGVMPLYGSEQKQLIAYAKKLKVPPEELYSIRSKIKTQREICQSFEFDMKKPMIEKQFTKLVLNLKIDHTKAHAKIRSFLESTGHSVQRVIRYVSTLPIYHTLGNDDISYLNEILEYMHKHELHIRKRAQVFEDKLADYLRVSYKIPFRTENEIHRDGDYTVTPDILFDKPIKLQVDGKSYTIRWMDAKNYLLIDIAFIMKSLKKQATKYNQAFGPGCFVFAYGFDASIIIPGVIMLDGSFI